MSSSRDEPRRRTSPDRGPAGEAKRVGSAQRAERSPVRDEGKSGAGLWEVIWERQNLLTALKRVESNRGAPGVDGMRVGALRPYMKEHWPEIREALESGRYRPSPVRRVEIPKPGDGVRELGIPTVLDRLLPAGGHAERVCRAGWLVEPKAEAVGLETLEARDNALP